MFNTPEITNQGFLETIERELEEMSIPTAEEQGGFENYISNMASILFDLPSLVVEINEGDIGLWFGNGPGGGILNQLELLSEQPPQTTSSLC